jgi:hypothetical protein
MNNASLHAHVRAQQRAIPPILIHLLLEFGATEPSAGGTRKVFFDKRARRRVGTYAGPLAAMLEEHLDVYAILGEHDRVVTVGHRTERVRRH